MQFGCGPIGCSIVRLAAQRAALSVCGAIDIDPALVGRDPGDVAGAGAALGAVVRCDAREALAELRPELVFHTTGSKAAEVFDQIALIAAAGANVVSTCEELAFPEYRDPDLAERLHALAVRHGVSILGTGVNPGFLMDTWPLFMSTLCEDVRRVRVARVQDASGRRIPFQQKIGAGLSVAEFDAAVAGGSFGHVGLQESAAMLAAGLGWRLDEISETIEPVLLDREVSSGHVTVPPGTVAGLKQVAVGTRAGEPAVELEFQAYLGAPRSYETVSLAGTPPLEVTIEGGTPGDTATAAIVVNSAAAVAAAAPGLYSMKDLPVVGCTADGPPQ
jgi:4-hydroxy-tetrahydrodipicolinate reductase